MRVPGRFEPVDEGQDFAVLVDYAHTPDSLENVLRAARELAGRGREREGRVLCVFGAGGDRDRGKRPLMGEIAARLADVVLVTSDNPRSEDPEAIIAEIMAGAAGGAGKGTGAAHARVSALADRREAIAEAVAAGEAGDVLVIAGKGHEQGQEFEGGRKVPFDDVAVAREASALRAGALAMRAWDAERVARAAGAELCGRERRARAGARGRRGRLARAAGRRAVRGPRGGVRRRRRASPRRRCARARGARCWRRSTRSEALAVARERGSAVLVQRDPLAALQALARAWRRELGEAGARVVAITGSSGKTSTKDILAALLGAELRTAATPANLNTEIGLPLAILAAPAGTECLVLEMAMRGPGQIAELTAIAEPDMAIDRQRRSRAPRAARLAAGDRSGQGGADSRPASGRARDRTGRRGAARAAPARRRADHHVRTREATFELLGRGPGNRVRIGHRGETIELEPSFSQAHNLRNLLAAVAAAQALGHTPGAARWRCASRDARPAHRARPGACA